ncbi:LuxR C-terminal-related transcriptional regulator [Agromyces sp. NPDC058484]|uniref:LuxR C-terminal-related transcriptional regulator n=1 Tax=Agromyces sp. NPDC058484 TaxID=3346524 RepID=UPI00364F853E
MAEHLSSEYLVDRPALRRRLDAALSLPLTLVVAQAGAGKTVLLNQWAAAHPELAFVWLEVDAADADPVRFSRRLLAALATVRPEVMALTHLSALSAGGLGRPLLDALQVELESFPDLVLVLDDLHHLSSTRLLDDLGRLVAGLPPNVHVVMSTRVDPPIPWSRLRLRNQLLEIRQSDLSMSEEEGAELLTSVSRRDIPVEVLHVLITRTEGWAAGLQLAGLTLRLHPDAEGFVTEFGGTDRLIADYLAEEVLAAIAEPDRAILLRMSPLDSMTADLVDHVLERSDAQGLFERLERESMFIVALDAHREQFRFHHLFRDLLRHHLHAEEPGEEARLLGRAAEFHLAHGEPAPAVEYLLRARDWDRALDAIMTRGSDVFERGEMNTVIRWISTVPEAIRNDRLDVALEFGVLVGMRGEAARAVDTLTRVANDPRVTVGQRIIAHSWISATAQWNPHPAETIRATERSLALLESDPGAEFPDLMHLTTPELLTTVAMGSGGRSQFFAGNLARADEWMMRTLGTEGIAYPPFRVGLLGSLALLRIWCGRASDAERLVAEALETAASSGLPTHPIAADAYFAEAMLAYERGLPDAAAAPLRNGMIRAESNHRTQLMWISWYLQALLAVADGRPYEALELVDLSTHDTASAPAPVILDRIVALHMSVLRRTGRSEEALRLRGGAPPTSADLAFETVAASLALGRREPAQLMLPTMDDLFDEAGPRGDILRSIALAWAAELGGEHPVALEQIGVALDRAEADGLVEVFIGTDPVVLDLIAELSSVRGGLTATILSRWRQAQPRDANAGLPEPLTERELEILAYLPGHSTTAELAKLCFVSVNTLKTHVMHIYRKLGVTGRSEAIARARELGLLDPVIPTAHARV